jgi:LacI family transcriptional regulator
MNAETPSSKGRVGLRQIAEAAGVCLMTVSLSLRDSPKISPATRERIHRFARELGYRPDPELSRLMKHLRTSRTSRGRTGLALVDLYPAAGFTENLYNRSIREGAARRAAELGFGVTTIHGAEYGLNLRGILHVVHTRGIDGIVLLPAAAPLTLESGVDWSHVSVVTTSNSILAPRFHYVVPNQFGNTMRLIEHVQARGHRRVCAIFDEFFDERTGHNFTAAFKWHGHQDRILIVPQQLAAAKKCERTLAWINRHRPDAVFVQSDAVGAAVRKLVRKRGSRLDFELIALGAHNAGGFSYVDERADLVGAGAVDLLAGMMYYHETGIPAHPRTTLIDGDLAFVTE